MEVTRHTYQKHEFKATSFPVFTGTQLLVLFYLYHRLGSYAIRICLPFGLHPIEAGSLKQLYRFIIIMHELPWLVIHQD